VGEGCRVTAAGEAIALSRASGSLRVRAPRCEETDAETRASGEGGAMLTPGSREPTTRCVVWAAGHLAPRTALRLGTTRLQARTRGEGPHRQRVREGRRGVPQKQRPRCKQEEAAQRWKSCSAASACQVAHY
jgi:hypothetical protein